MKNIFEYLKKLYLRQEPVTRAQVVNRRFSEQVRGQLIQLKEMGLTIPVFTL